MEIKTPVYSLHTGVLHELVIRPEHSSPLVIADVHGSYGDL